MSNFYAEYPIKGGGGVTSIDGITGAVTLVAGSGISVTDAGQTITIANTLTQGANTTLSNLVSPTAVNQDLIFNTGSAASLKTQDGTTASLQLVVNSGDATVSGNTGTLTLHSGNATAGNSGGVSIFSGTAGAAGTSGNISLTTGTTSGTRGSIRFQDGSQGTVGAVWTETTTAGAGTWSALPASANTSLSNLSAVAINTSLLPGSDVTISLGSPSDRYVTTYTQAVQNSATSNIDINGRQLHSSDGTNAISYDNRLLQDTASTTQLSWNTTGVTIGKALLLNGSTSGALTLQAAATTTPYSITMPSAQATGALTNNGSGVLSWTPTTTGTVTSVSVVSANGLAGTVATSTTTPALTLSTTVTGILQGNGTAISAASTTGSGNVVLATSPTLTTPALGTPSALVGTNITGTAAGLTAGTVTTNANMTGDVTSVGNATTLATVNSNVGSFTTANITVNAKGLITAASNGSAGITALTGDVTASGSGSVAATIAANAVTNAKAAQMAAYTVKGNNTSSTSNAADLTVLQMVSMFANTLQPNVQILTASSGTYGVSWYFQCSSVATATIGATYTNNGQTFTVAGTVSGSSYVLMVGTGAPSTPGTLTKATGTGDATIAAALAINPTRIEVEMIGAGGSGGSNGTGATLGSSGGSTTFGSSFLTCGGGGAAAAAGAAATGGSAGVVTSLPSGVFGIAINGAQGNSAPNSVLSAGASGAPTRFSGGGAGAGSSTSTFQGGPANATSGAGGGGAGGATSINGCPGGGSGAYIYATVTKPSNTYAFTVGSGGTHGTVGTGGAAGGAGGSGVIYVTEYFW